MKKHVLRGEALIKWRDPIGRLVQFLIVSLLAAAAAGTGVARAGEPTWVHQSATSSSSAGDDYVADQLVVQTRGGVSESGATRVFSRYSGEIIDSNPQVQTFVIHVPADQLDRVQSALSKQPQFKSVSKNFSRRLQLTPNDAYYPGQWHLPKIQAPEAWDITTGNANVIIAVIDSGVTAVTDLASKLLPGVNLIDSTDTSDGLNHGTPVAGIAAAVTNNVTGVAGVAWLNDILPVKVYTSSGTTTCSAIVNGITWAADHGASVINMSFSGISQCSGESSAIDYAWNKGAVLVASAGNDSSSTPNYPAAYSNVIGVSATLKDDSFSPTSNYGSWISLSAPGCGIYTTYNTGSYSSACGTSAAAPVISGVAGLVISANPTLSNSQVKSILEQNADDLGAAGFDIYYGWGRVNAYKAVLAAVGTSAPAPDTTPPTASISSPTAGSTVSGITTISVSATDNVGVSKVELYVDGTLLGTDTSSPFSFAWDTTLAANANHTLQAIAYDAAGNSGSSTSVGVTVSNVTASSTPPSVTVVSPSGGTTVTGVVTIQAAASDSTQLTQLQAYIDGKMLTSTTCSATSCSGSFKWNTRKAAKGTHTISAKAYNSAGAVGLSTLVTVYK